MQEIKDYNDVADACVTPLAWYLILVWLSFYLCILWNTYDSYA